MEVVLARTENSNLYLFDWYSDGTHQVSGGGVVRQSDYSVSSISISQRYREIERKKDRAIEWEIERAWQYYMTSLDKAVLFMVS